MSIEKLTPGLCRSRASASKSTMWRINRMNSVPKNRALPQLRCLPVQGKLSSYKYERKLSGRRVPCSRDRVEGITGVVNRWGSV